MISIVMEQHNNNWSHLTMVLHRDSRVENCASCKQAYFEVYENNDTWVRENCEIISTS